MQGNIGPPIGRRKAYATISRDLLLGLYSAGIEEEISGRECAVNVTKVKARRNPPGASLRLFRIMSEIDSMTDFGSLDLAGQLTG